jgi:hypothetical protein
MMWTLVRTISVLCDRFLAKWLRGQAYVLSPPHACDCGNVKVRTIDDVEIVASRNSAFGHDRSLGRWVSCACRSKAAP